VYENDRFNLVNPDALSQVPDNNNQRAILTDGLFYRLNAAIGVSSEFNDDRAIIIDIEDLPTRGLGAAVDNEAPGDTTFLLHQSGLRFAKHAVANRPNEFHLLIASPDAFATPAQNVKLILELDNRSGGTTTAEVRDLAGEVFDTRIRPYDTASVARGKWEADDASILSQSRAYTDQQIDSHEHGDLINDTVVLELTSQHAPATYGHVGDTEVVLHRDNTYLWYSEEPSSDGIKISSFIFNSSHLHEHAQGTRPGQNDRAKLQLSNVRVGRGAVGDQTGEYTLRWASYNAQRADGTTPNNTTAVTYVRIDQLTVT